MYIERTVSDSRFVSRSALLGSLCLAVLAACGGESADGASGSTVGDPNNPGTVGDPNNPGTVGNPGDPNAVLSDDVNGFVGGPPPVNPMGETCIQEDVEIETLTPSVELLVDRSGSMNADFGAMNRWDTIRDVLINPTTGLVKTMENKVRFGLSLYTSYMTETDTAATCPNLEEQPIGLNNYMPIATTFTASQIFGQSSTPTAEGVAAATSKLEIYPEIGPKVIVLATDGDPDTCANPDSNGTDPPRLASEAAVQAAFDKGIRTYVIAVGEDITDLQHMQNLASIGQGGDPNAAYFPALNTQGLVDAFNEILRGVISCDFELNGTLTPENAAKGTVSIDGMALPYNDPNGWVLVGESTVRLQGTACDTLKISVSLVDIDFPCGTIVIR